MCDDLLRLSSALESAREDLSSARVLVDAALRQLEDQVEARLAEARDQGRRC